MGGLGSTEDVFHTLRDTGSHIDLVQIDRLLFRASREQLWIPPGGRGVCGAAPASNGASSTRVEG